MGFGSGGGYRPSPNHIAGSTTQGSSPSDTHQVTGSLLVNGNVGVGTDSPQALLHVSSSVDGDTLFKVSAYDQTTDGIVVADLAGTTYTSINTDMQTSYPLSVAGNGGISIRATNGHLATTQAAYGLWLQGQTLVHDTTNFVFSDTVNMPTAILSSPTIPGSAGDAGTAGQVAWDADYIYICVADSTWKRAAISTWP